MNRESVLDLVNKLYLEDLVIGKNIPKEVTIWATGVMMENFDAAESEGVKDKVVGKTTHTREVVAAGEDIMNGSPDEKWDFSLGLLICFLHDIGRFLQAHKNTFSDQVSGVDHASLGCQMIKEAGFSNEIIEEAIFHHSRIEYLGGNAYAKLIRDADKLAILRVIERLTGMAERLGYSKGKPCKIIVDSFVDKIKVETKYLVTKADWILFFGTWFWDLNFEVTGKMVCNEKIPERIVDLLTREGMGGQDLKQVRAGMLEFKKNYGIQKN
ncbi:MAG: HD domain-containing protein [Candidatus Shapirobacteria bacterium]